MIHLSPSAITEIKRLKSKQQQPNPWFRLVVKSGGCSGLFYDLSFDETICESDRVFECDGIKVAIDTKTIDYLDNLTVDYSEDLMGGGFRFHNLKASTTCGCGNSFTVQ